MKAADVPAELVEKATRESAALVKEATALRHKAAEHERRMDKLEADIAGALNDAENERDGLRDEVEAFRNDLTALREGLMERVGRYTPSDADLLAYVDALKAQIATQEPAGEPAGGSAGRGASGGLGERLRAEAEAGRVGQHARLSAIADEADRLHKANADLQENLRAAGHRLEMLRENEEA